MSERRINLARVVPEGSMYSVKSGILSIAILIRVIVVVLVLGGGFLLWHHQAPAKAELRVGWSGMECHEAFKGDRQIPCKEINFGYDEYKSYQVGEHEARVEYDAWFAGRDTTPRLAGVGWSQDGKVYSPPPD